MIKMLRFFYWFLWKKSNFSQSDEEQVIKKIFKNKAKGFYVDVGCYHPRRYSNTAYLYKIGWNGVNIDADINNLSLFKFFRRRDFNLNYFVSDKKKYIDFCIFNERALNGIYNEERLQIIKKRGYKPRNFKKIETFSLDEILSLNNLQDKEIDFLDIDAEGHDLEVLKSINLKSRKIKLILIEVGDEKKNIDLYLKDHGYSEYFKEDRNVFYLKN